VHQFDGGAPTVRSSAIFDTSRPPHGDHEEHEGRPAENGDGQPKDDPRSAAMDDEQVDHDPRTQDRGDYRADDDDTDPSRGGAGDDDTTADHGQQSPNDEQSHLAARDYEDAGYRVRDDEVSDLREDLRRFGREEGYEHLCEHRSEQRDDDKYPEKPDRELVHLSSIGASASVVGRPIHRLAVQERSHLLARQRNELDPGVVGQGEPMLSSGRHPSFEYGPP
jgi:hypothetical protein